LTFALVMIALIALFVWNLYSSMQMANIRSTADIKPDFKTMKELSNKRDDFNAGNNYSRGRLLASVIGDDNSSGIYSANLSSASVQRVNTGRFVIEDIKSRNGIYVISAADTGNTKPHELSAPDLYSKMDIYVSTSRPALAFSKYKKLNINKSVYLPSHISVNSLGKILFVATDKASRPKTDTEHLKGWNIYLTDTHGTGPELLLKDALYPQWVSNSEFVYLSKDGLYKYSLKGKTHKKIWDIHGDANANMKFTVSPDGKYLAWSFIDNSLFVVLKFVKKDVLREVSISRAQVLDMQWLDKNHLAVIGNTTDKKFDLMLLNVENKRIIESKLQKTLDINSLIKNNTRIYFLDYIKL